MKRDSSRFLLALPLVLLGACGPDVPIANVVDAGGLDGGSPELDAHLGDAIQEDDGHIGDLDGPWGRDAAEPCSPVGAEEPCYTGPAGTEGKGVCHGGVRHCGQEGWGPCTGQQLPGPEACNGLDDDCDGQADEGLTCLERYDPCDPQSTSVLCIAPFDCVEHPGGLTYCDELTPCTNGHCGPLQSCVTFGEGDYGQEYCWDIPQIGCFHEWYDVVCDGEGHHADTQKADCVHNPTVCTETAGYQDHVEITCSKGVARGDRSGYPILPCANGQLDFFTVDIPIVNPHNVKQCLVAWGVHPLRRIDGQNPPNVSDLYTFVFDVPVGGLSDRSPLTVGGFQTSLPRAAYQNYILEAPPPASVIPPTSKQERAARILWEESSAAQVRSQNMPYSYENCPASYDTIQSCDTWDELMQHMYPGPEIFGQGAARDPADSNFVLPVYLPYYDTHLGTRNVVVVVEYACELGNGDRVHRSLAVAVLDTYPTSLPQDY